MKMKHLLLLIDFTFSKFFNLRETPVKNGYVKNEKKNEPSSISLHQMVLEIYHFKVRNLGRLDIAIL